MPRARSSAVVTVVSILNLVGGFLGLLVTLFSLIGLFVIYANKAPVGGPLDTMAIQNHIRLVRPEYKFIEIGGVGLGFLLDMMLIASGFGLIWRKKWARYLALIWAVMSFTTRLFTTGYSLFVVVPTMGAYMDIVLANQPQLAPTKTGMVMGGYIGACGSGVLIAYPIVVFCLLLTQSATMACEPPSRDEENEDDEDDDYDNRRRDRPRPRYRDEDRFDERDDRGRR